MDVIGLINVIKSSSKGHFSDLNHVALEPSGTFDLSLSSPLVRAIIIIAIPYQSPNNTITVTAQDGSTAWNTTVQNPTLIRLSLVNYNQIKFSESNSALNYPIDIWFSYAIFDNEADIQEVAPSIDIQGIPSNNITITGNTAGLATNATVQDVVTTLGTPAQDSTVSSVKTALGSPAQDSTVSSINTTLGSPAQDSSVQSVKTNTANIGTPAQTSQLPSSLSTNGNLKQSLEEDLVGLAKELQLPSSLDANGNLKSGSVLTSDLIGLLKDSKIPSAIQQDSNGALYHVLKTDLVGLFKQGQNIGTFSQSPITLQTDNIGLFKPNQNIGQIVTPVIARTTIAAGYQESALYLNNGSNGLFMSGSSADSSNNATVANVSSIDTINQNGSGTSVSGCWTVFTRFQAPISGVIIGNQCYQSASSTVTRTALYSDSSGSVGSLIDDLGQYTTTSNTRYAVASKTVLTAGTYYWIAITYSSALFVIYESGGIGVEYINASYVNGFPSTVSGLTSYASGTNANWYLYIAEPTSITLTFDLGEVNSTTFNGQVVSKFALYSSASVQGTITDLTITSEGTTAGTIRTNNLGSFAISFTGNDSFFTDAGASNNITLNAGDTLQVQITFTLYGDIATYYLDNLNGVSYVVLPLVS